MEFRFKALHQQHDPDDLDTSVNLANPKSWIAVFVALVLIVAAVGWSVLGRLPRTATGQGVITRTDGIVRIEIGYAAVVVVASVVPGDHVAAGGPLLTVTDPGGARRQVTASASGTVMTADYEPGMLVPAGTPLITLERDPDDGPALSAMIVMPTAAAAGVESGMAVDLAVAAVSPAAFGLLRGRVSAVAAYPLTQARLESLIYDQSTVLALLSHGPAVLVTVDLVADRRTASGYAWSSPSGPPYPLSFQSAVSADIRLGSTRPIDYVFGDS